MLKRGTIEFSVNGVQCIFDEERLKAKFEMIGALLSGNFKVEPRVNIEASFLKESDASDNEIVANRVIALYNGPRAQFHDVQPRTVKDFVLDCIIKDYLRDSTSITIYPAHPCEDYFTLTYEEMEIVLTRLCKELPSHHSTSLSHFSKMTCTEDLPFFLYWHGAHLDVDAPCTPHGINAFKRPFNSLRSGTQSDYIYDPHKLCEYILPSASADTLLFHEAIDCSDVAPTAAQTGPEDAQIPELLPFDEFAAFFHKITENFFLIHQLSGGEGGEGCEEGRGKVYICGEFLFKAMRGIVPAPDDPIQISLMSGKFDVAAFVESAKTNHVDDCASACANGVFADPIIARYHSRAFSITYPKFKYQLDVFCEDEKGFDEDLELSCSQCLLDATRRNQLQLRCTYPYLQYLKTGYASVTHKTVDEDDCAQYVPFVRGMFASVCFQTFEVYFTKKTLHKVKRYAGTTGVNTVDRMFGELNRTPESHAAAKERGVFLDEFYWSGRIFKREVNISGGVSFVSTCFREFVGRGDPFCESGERGGAPGGVARPLDGIGLGGDNGGDNDSDSYSDFFSDDESPSRRGEDVKIVDTDEIDPLCPPPDRPSATYVYRIRPQTYESLKSIHPRQAHTGNEIRVLPPIPKDVDTMLYWIKMKRDDSGNEGDPGKIIFKLYPFGLIENANENTLAEWSKQMDAFIEEERVREG